jgi:hypothetical protein
MLRLQCALALGASSGEAITVGVVDTDLVPRGLDASEAEDLRQLFAAVDAAKYAPGGGPASLAGLRERAESAVAVLQRLEGGHP